MSFDFDGKRRVRNAVYSPGLKSFDCRFKELEYLLCILLNQRNEIQFQINNIFKVSNFYEKNNNNNNIQIIFTELIKIH